MKNIVNLILIYLLFLHSPLVACGTTISGATQNGNVFNVTPSHFSSSGTTGFRQYSNFTLDENHIVNLEFQNNMNKFVNIVNNPVTINGILNTVKNGNFYNGNAIFITNGGFTIGASGVINVGSLNVYTTNKLPDINELSSMVDSSLENNIDSFKTHMAHPITINGKILAFEDVNLYGKSLTTSENSVIITGFNPKESTTIPTQYDIATKNIASQARSAANIRISDIINTGNAKELSNNYTFSSSKGKITIVSKDNVNIQGKIACGKDFNIESNNEIILSGPILVKNNINIDNDSKSSLVIRNEVTIFDNGNFNINKKNGKTHIQSNSIININKGNLTIIQEDTNVDKLSELSNSLQINGKVILNDGDVLITHDSPKSMRIDSNTIIANNFTINNFNSLNIHTYSPEIFISSIIYTKNDLNILNSSSSKIFLDNNGILNANNINIYNGYYYKDSGPVHLQGTILANNNLNITNNGVGQLIIDQNAYIESTNGNTNILGKRGSGSFNINSNFIKAKKILTICHEDDITTPDISDTVNVKNITYEINKIITNETNLQKNETNNFFNTYITSNEEMKIIDIKELNTEELITIYDLEFYNKKYFLESKALYF